MTVAPLAIRSDGWLRRLLAWPARIWDGAVKPQDLPQISVDERYRRLLRQTPPEGGLALQPGLATVGDDDAWTSFVARGTTALAVGGVHGADRPAAFARFRDETRALGIARQAVYPLREPDLAAATEAGFTSLPIAVEAWVDLEDFTLKGKRFADLRQMRNRAEKHGIVSEEVDPARWRASLTTTWRAFLDGRNVPWQVRWLSGGPVFDTTHGHRTFVAHLDGAVQAFVTVLPGARGQASLDVMCRSPQALAGSMEVLLVNVLSTLRDEGVRRVSLGPCPLAEGTAHQVPGLLGVAARWAWGSPVANRWLGFRRLAAFKAKFRPQYELVHLGLAPARTPWALYLVARIWALGD